MNKRERQLVNDLAQMVTPVLAKRPDRERPIAKIPGFSVRMSSADTAEIMIYGRIGGGGWFDDGGVTAADMAEQLNEISAPNIHVRINSGGGDVFEGVAIHTQLRRHAATVTAFVDGLAASAASFIAMAGDKVVIARGAMMMIHDGMTGTYGGPKAHARSLDLLNKVSDTIADLYAARAGEDAAHWRALMSVNDEDGTWYTAQEAVDAGLADEMTDPDEDEPATTARNLRRWSNVLPERLRSTLTNKEQELEETKGMQESTPESTEESTPETDSQENPGTLDQPAGDMDENAPNTDDPDNDFQFAMQMWHWLNTDGRKLSGAVGRNA